METASAPLTTGSNTIADMLPRAVELFGNRVAQKHKVDGEWRDVTFAEVNEIVSEIGRGLIDLGLEPGERVSVLCTTRVEWTWCSLAISAAGAVVVPIYPTNSPEECAWVAGTRNRSWSSVKTLPRWPRSMPSAISCPRCARSW